MQGGIADPATVGVIWVPTGAVDFGFVWATPVDDVASHWLVGALGRRWWTDAASDGWFGALGAALVDDAASDGWFGALGAALVDDAASDGWFGSLGAALVDDVASHGWFGALGAALVDDVASHGWFGALGAALVDDAASDRWFVRLDRAGGRCGIRWVVGSLDNPGGPCIRRSTMPAPRKNSPRGGGRKGHPEIPRFSGSLFD
jgi:hypothetical protein